MAPQLAGRRQGFLRRYTPGGDGAERCHHILRHGMDKRPRGKAAEHVPRPSVHLPVQRRARRQGGIRKHILARTRARPVARLEDETLGAHRMGVEY